MQAINFLYKVSKLTNKHDNSTITLIKVFNPLNNSVKIIKELDNLSDTDIMYKLQTCKDFAYKHYQVYFSNVTTMKF